MKKTKVVLTGSAGMGIIGPGNKNSGGLKIHPASYLKGIKLCIYWII